MGSGVALHTRHLMTSIARTPPRNALRHSCRPSARDNRPRSKSIVAPPSYPLNGSCLDLLKPDVPAAKRCSGFDPKPTRGLADTGPCRHSARTSRARCEAHGNSEIFESRPDVSVFCLLGPNRPGWRLEELVRFRPASSWDGVAVS
jgi:hypothetical protein